VINCLATRPEQIMNRIKYIGLLLTALLVSSCAEEQAQEISVRTVRTMSVGLGSQNSLRTFNGQAQTDRVVDLSFRSNGIITKFDIQLGKTVNKGDLLAELDNVSARLSYEQAVTSLNSAKSQVNTVELHLKRVQNLYEKGGSSLSDYENAKNAYRAARSSYRSAQRSVEIQQDQIQFGKIYAPETGVIASVSKEVDENASVGETVAVLNAGSDMEIEVGIPENVINLVKQSTKVNISFAAIGDAIFTGEVSEISPSIDRQTATYPVRVSLLGDIESIRSGMAATVNFDFTDLNNTEQELLVPATAVGEDSKGRFVFIVEKQPDDSHIVRKSNVEIGKLVNNDFEVLSGLELGDNIITAGVHSVLDGQRVKM
jgi:multidrug efflux system membrane fusion protein